MASTSTYRNIFFLTDFSKNAKRALPFAAEIAHRSGAKLFLFHASQETIDITPGYKESKEKSIDYADKEFDKLIKELRKNERYENLTITTILQSGHPTANLKEQVADHDAGLIVMGTKGARGSRNVIFGSVTSGIINKSDVPVLAVPAGCEPDNLKNIIFATDYHGGDLEALQQLSELAGLFDASITVVHVADQRNLKSEIEFRGFRELVKQQVDYEKIDFHIEYDSDFFDYMSNYLIDNPASLLVMVRYRKTFWESLLERDHSREMAFYSEVPLLVLIGKEPKS